jgi:hypothetical protein
MTSPVGSGLKIAGGRNRVFIGQSPVRKEARMSETIGWPILTIDPAQRAAGDPGVALIDFPSGVEVVLSGFGMAKGSVITFPDTPQTCRVSAIFFLTGRMELRLGNGAVGRWVPGTACLVRSDTPGFRLVAQDSGWKSHVCVSMACSDLAARFPDGPPEVLLDYLFHPGEVDAIRELMVTRSMSSTAQALQASALGDAFGRSRCEPLALQFLFEALAALLLPDPGGTADTSLALERARSLHDAVSREPTVELLRVLGPDLTLQDQRAALRMFEARYGMSLRSFRHRTIMEIARAELMEGAMIKQLAHDLGYAHLANFTRAYRRAFGESPRQTLRRKAMAQNHNGITAGMQSHQMAARGQADHGRLRDTECAPGGDPQ